MQRRIRHEILDIGRQNAEHDCDLDNYENMPLLNAFIKEVLRYHPVEFNIRREAVKDTVIPLSKPITLLSGKVVSELPTSKGQKVWVNVAGYNRLPELFGPDADEFNIDRWLDASTMKDEKRSQSLGVYSNLMTFGHGNRACIGWRLAVWEIRVVIAELLSNFEFALVPGGEAIRRAPALNMTPGVKGKRGVAPSMPLMVSILQN